MDYHITKNGTKIKLSEMTDEHLKNTINLLQKQAEKGITVQTGDSGPSAEDYWYDEQCLKNEEAFEYLDGHKYVKEWNRRTRKANPIKKH